MSPESTISRRFGKSENGRSWSQSKILLSSMGVGRWMVWEAWTLDGGQGGWAGIMITLVLKVAWSKVERRYSPEYLAEAMFIVAK